MYLIHIYTLIQGLHNTWFIYRLAVRRTDGRTDELSSSKRLKSYSKQTLEPEFKSNAILLLLLLFLSATRAIDDDRLKYNCHWPSILIVSYDTIRQAKSGNVYQSIYAFIHVVRRPSDDTLLAAV